MRPHFYLPAALAAALMSVSVPTASAQQAINFSLGSFALRGADGRTTGDLTDEDVLIENSRVFDLDVNDFNSISLGAEYLYPIGEYLEASGGVAFTRRTVPTVYSEFVRPNGSEIEQDLSLRIVPITGTIRVLLLGRRGVVQPYVGAGIGVFAWKYREEGDFIDFSLRGLPVFEATYEESGTSIGPVAVFGARVPLGAVAVGGELRYQKATGDLSDDFLGSKIDLGGWHFLGTVAVRF